MARADRLRQSDPPEGDAGHHRRVHQSRRCAPAPLERAAALQSQLRVRRTRRPVCALSARGNSAGSGKNYNITTERDGRAIAGASSGAICAFTAAWERPDAFSKVFSTIGTYVGLRGGNDYPTLVRKTEPKPIRVFLQDGSNDLNIYGGDWWVANQDMLSALSSRATT